MSTCENCKKLEIRIAELEEQLATKEEARLAWAETVHAQQRRIAELEEELANRDDEFAAAEERLARASQRTREAESLARRHKQEAEDAESFRDMTTGEIKRAMERGDDTAVSRGLEKLRRGW